MPTPGEIDRTTGVTYNDINGFQRELLAFMLAIAGIESGGDPNAQSMVNSGGRGRAKGVFQFLDATWQGVAPKLGINTRTASDATAEQQWAVAAYLMSSYFKTYGSWDLVATAWFAGGDRAAALKRGDTSILNYKDGNGFSVRQYINKMTGLQKQHLAAGVSGTGRLEQAALQGSAAISGLPADGVGLPAAPAGMGGGTADSNTAWNEGVSPTGENIGGVAAPFGFGTGASGAGVPGGGVAVAGLGGATIPGAQGDFAIADTDRSGDVNDEEVRAYIQRNFPQVAWALDHPELGQILRDAAAEDWDTARIYGKLIQTDWWKSNPDHARVLANLKANDPATWEKMVADRAEELRELGNAIGWQLDGERLQAIAVRSINEGWNPQMMSRYLQQHAPLDLTAIRAGEVGGTMAAAFNTVEELARKYMVRLSDRELEEHTRKLLTGELTEESFQNYAEQLALTQFPWAAQALERGIDPSTFVTPYAGWIAQEYELDAQTIDMSDGKYQEIMYDREQQRIRTLPEIQEYIRSTPEWSRTQKAGAAYAGLAESLMKTFGKVA